MGLDRVLQRAAVDLDRVRDPLGQRPGQDRRSHHQVVGQRHVGAGAVGHLAHGRHVGLQVSRELLVVQLGERPGVDPRIAVGDVHRQQAADVRPVDGAAGRPAALLHPQGATIPVPGGVDEVQLQRIAVLAEQVHLVAQADQRGRDLAVVDVRAGAPEEVAVEDQDPHAACMMPCSSRQEPLVESANS